MPKVVVIGASAAGLIAACETSRAGFETVVLESKSEPGLNPADTFINSMSRKCDIKVPKGTVVRTVKGYRVIPPSGELLVFRNPGVKVDRRLFDEHYISKIEARGGKVLMGKTVDRLEIADGLVREAVTTRGKSYDADYFIIASGLDNDLLRYLPFEPIKYPDDVAYGVQADMRNIEISPDYFDFYIGNDVAPGWKAVVSPRSESKGSVGVYIRGQEPGDEEDYFVDLLESVPGLKDGKVIKKYRGLDPVVVIPKQLVWNNLCLVGTAGGQAGLPYGMIAGRIAARAIVRCKGNLGRLRKYEKLWKKWYLKDYKRGRKAIRLMDGMTDEELNSAFEVLNELNVTKKNLAKTSSILGMAVQFLIKSPKLFFRVTSIWIKNR